jgi:hypothetical protein
MNKDDIINGLTKELAKIRDREIRKYNFTPEQITPEEKQIIGDAYDSGVMNVIEKWFKYMADKNNDLLIHTYSMSEEQRNLYRLAVLMYDDWVSFVRRCKAE